MSVLLCADRRRMVQLGPSWSCIHAFVKMVNWTLVLIRSLSAYQWGGSRHELVFCCNVLEQSYRLVAAWILVKLP